MQRLSSFRYISWAFIFLVLLKSNAYASVDPPVIQVLDGSLNQLQKDSFSVVQDSKFFNPAYNSILIKPYLVQNKITLHINQASLYNLKDSFTVHVQVRVYKTNANNTVDSNDVMLIVYYYPTSVNFPANTYVFTNGYQVKAKILSVSSTVTWNVWKGLVLENELQSYPQYVFSYPTDTIQSVTHSILDSATQTDELPVSWTNTIGADQYDLEWTYIDSSAIAMCRYCSTQYPNSANPDPNLLFDANASRVTIKGTSYNIPLIYDGTGYLFFRVRAVQVQGGGGLTNGPWSSGGGGTGKFYFKGHQRNLNWQSTISFAEEGKRKVVIQYYDGSLRARQTVTKDNSTNTTLVSESYYDYQGRPVIQVLPAPTFSTVIHYSQNFNIGLNGGAYDKSNFDSLSDPTMYCSAPASPMKTDSGAALYYSPGNAQAGSGFSRFIPDAQGYPFVQVEYVQDNSGRISRQGGAGPTYQLGTGHETQYFYGSPDQRELDALFGTEVGDHSHYLKTMVRDANGQYNVSYTDMHGRTIATALAGTPDSVKLDTLTSYTARSITETLSDSTTNVVKDLVMESKKGLLVATPGSYLFNYQLNPQALQIKGCDSSTVCYDCMYDLEITMTSDCNNLRLGLGGQPYDTVIHNLSMIDTSCSQVAGGISVSFSKYLPEGSYEITKRLTVNRSGEQYYRDSIFLKKNTCRSASSFLQQQRAIQAAIIQCQPSCKTCTDSLGTWATYYNRFITRAGIASGDSSYKAMIMQAYLKAQSDCQALCGSTNESDDILQSLLQDLTPPSGQYANLDSAADIYSIFNTPKDGNANATSPADFSKPTNYLNGDGLPDSVYDEGTGNMVLPQNLTAQAFVQKFKSSWSAALLPYHPEYCKWQQYQQLQLSTAWDRRFESTDTYAAALQAGYLNPTANPGLPFSKYNPSSSSPDYDPLAVTYSNGTNNYKANLESQLTNYTASSKNSINKTITLWQMATANVRCANKDSSCINNYVNVNDSAFNVNMCTGDLDMAWRSFRQMYLDIKRHLINVQLNNSCPSPSTATLIAKGHQPHFTDASELISATNSDLPANRNSAIQQQQNSVASYYASTCLSYATMWWNALKPCNYSSADSAAIIPLLVQVCEQGSDATHPYGASSVSPASTYQYRSFEDVIDKYNAGLGIKNSSSCNAYGIKAPKPYDQQVVYNIKPLWTAPDSCECSQISAYYNNYLLVAGHYSSFSDYMARAYQTNISDSTLTALRNLCSVNPAAATCNFFQSPLQLPAAFQCNSGDLCVGCTQFKALDAEFRSKYPAVIPVALPSATDSVQLAANQLYEQFMNYRLGFGKSAQDYLAFLNSCNGLSNNPIQQINCDTLQQILSKYKTFIWQRFGTTVDFGTQEGQSFTNLHDIEHNGYIELPDSIRQKPGSWYNNIELTQNGGYNYNWASGYAIELRMKFLQGPFWGDQFYFNAINLSAVFTQYPTSFTSNGKTYAPGLYMSGLGDAYGNQYGADFGSNGFDYVLADANLNDLLNWNVVKLQITPAMYYVYYNGNLIYSIARNTSNPILNSSTYVLGLHGRQGALDWAKLYDANNQLGYFEDFNDPNNPAFTRPSYLSPALNLNLPTDFQSYFNSQRKTSYTYSYIDSLYLMNCGMHVSLNYPSYYDTAAISCGGLDSLLSAYKKVYLQPSSGYADLDMRTFAGNITPAAGPKGVFDINGQLLGNTVSGTTDQINASFAQIWNSSVTNQQVGTLSPLPTGQFRLQLKAGHLVPQNGIVGMRYYQFDIPYDTLDAVITNLGSYVDFGDGQGIRVDSVMSAGNTKIGVTNSNMFETYKTIYVSHIYSNAQLRTVTVYHTDIYGIVGFDNYLDAAHARYLPNLKNLRGYAPQDLRDLQFHSTQDSTMNTLNGFANKDQLTGLVFVNFMDGGGGYPFENYNFGNLQQHHSLKYFWISLGGSNPFIVDSALPAMKTNFPGLRYIQMNGPIQYSVNTDLSLPALRGVFLWYLTSTGRIDSLLNQVGLNTQVDSGYLLIGNGFRSAASASAVARLASMKWQLSLQDTTINGSVPVSKFDTIFNPKDHYPAAGLFTDFINNKFGLTLTPVQINALFMGKCGVLPNYSTPDTSTVPPFKDTCSSYSFMRTYSQRGQEKAYDMTQTPDGGYLLAGQANSIIMPTAPSSGFVMKTDKQGLLQWYANYGGSGNSNLVKIKNTRDGGFIALGNTNSFDQPQGEPFLVKGDANGNVQWSRTFGAGTQYGEGATDVIQTSEGGYAVAANYNNTAGLADLELFRLDSSGNTIWAQHMGTSSSDNAGGLLEDRDTLVYSGLAISSNLGNPSTYYDGVVMKVNKATGAIIWTRSYDLDSRCNWFHDIYSTPTGYIINTVASNSYSPPFGNIQGMIVELDKNGVIIRTRKIPTPPGIDAGSVVLSPASDGGYLSIQGENNTNADMYIHKTNSSGSIAWSNKIVLTGDQHITRVIQNADGTYTGAGYSDNQILLIRISNTGTTGCHDSTTSFINATPASTIYNSTLVNQSFTLHDTLRNMGLGAFTATYNTLCYKNTCGTVIKDTLFLCGRAAVVFPPVSPDSVNNCSDSSFFEISKSTELFNAYIDSLKGNFDSSYRAKCLQAYRIERFTVTHAVSEYHFALYYYDQAGNLLKTVPPAGVQANYDSLWLNSVAAARALGQSVVPAHGLLTQFRYNTLNQIVSQKTPDAGQNSFWYDRLGRLTISQNYKQKTVSSGEQGRQYIYTLYDYLGRITEVGQITNAGTIPMTDSISRKDSLLSAWLTASVANKEQVIQTVYDIAYPGYIGASFPAPIIQRNLRNRVSYSSFTIGSNPANYNHGTFYTYDIEGNVDTLLQDFGNGSLPGVQTVMNTHGHRFKKLAYNYDLISGKVNMMQYQPGWTDGIIHKYTYDAENRLTLVETSMDSVNWEREASYQYYKHGPLARTVLGDQSVQGIDYTYTLQGWLKGVNSIAMDSLHDMGNDGQIGGANQYVAKDEYGFSLNYYTGDYKSINSSVSPFPGHSAYYPAGYNRPLYNGNISSMTESIRTFTNPYFFGGGTLLYNYRYDQLNRLSGMDALNGFNAGTNTWSGMTAIPQFGERIVYDGNGNILKYKRNGAASIPKPTMDSLNYHYYTNTNRLKYISDSVPSGSNGGFLDLNNQTDPLNYKYDSIGNLIADVSEGITNIKWNIYGKPSEIIHHYTAVDPDSDIAYTYDAAGNRVSQTASYQNTAYKHYYYYVRDAQGNVICMYDAISNSSNLPDIVPGASQWYIYGTRRLGVYFFGIGMDFGPGLIKYISGFYKVRGAKNYELTNHLGTVLIDIKDNRTAVPLATDSTVVSYYKAQVVDAWSYYPFGLTMPLRGSGDTKNYPFGFNGKEKDDNVKNWGRQINYGTRIYDPRVGRFLSVDPLQKQYASLTPYQFSSNSPIANVDVDGKEAKYYDEMFFTDYSSKGVIQADGKTETEDKTRETGWLANAFSQTTGFPAKTGTAFHITQDFDRIDKKGNITHEHEDLGVLYFPGKNDKKRGGLYLTSKSGGYGRATGDLDDDDQIPIPIDLLSSVVGGFSDGGGQIEETEKFIKSLSSGKMNMKKFLAELETVKALFETREALSKGKEAVNFVIEKLEERKKENEELEKVADEPLWNETKKATDVCPNCGVTSDSAHANEQARIHNAPILKAREKLKKDKDGKPEK